MTPKIIFLGLIFTSVILLAVISNNPLDSGRQLRPQAVQQFADQANSLSANGPGTGDNANLDRQQLPLSDDDTSAVAGSTTDDSDGPDVEQTIERSVTDDSVKVKIEQRVSGSQPVNNKIDLKVDTSQDPALVQINTKPVSCSSDSYDCSDFSTCSEAGDVFKDCGTDIHQLDPDANGIPCDSLCR
jgi:hypothetical protein